MKTKTLFSSFLTLVCLSSFAQETAKSTSTAPPIVHVFMGYVIRLSPDVEGRYHYDILQQGRPVVSQIRNPFNPSLSGLATTKDALKVARWQVQQLAAGVPPSFVIEQPMPQVVARQLNINTK